MQAAAWMTICANNAPSMVSLMSMIPFYTKWARQPMTMESMQTSTLRTSTPVVRLTT